MFGSINLFASAEWKCTDQESVADSSIGVFLKINRNDKLIHFNIWSTDGGTIEFFGRELDDFKISGKGKWIDAKKFRKVFKFKGPTKKILLSNKKSKLNKLTVGEQDFGRLFYLEVKTTAYDYTGGVYCTVD